MSDVVRPDGRVALMKLPRGCLPILLGILIVSIVLDTINLAGFPANREAVGKFACSLRPFALTGPLNIWIHPSQDVASQCAGHPDALAISVIFLAVKMTMSLGAAVIFFGLVICRPETFRATRDELQRRFQEAGRYQHELKEFMKSSIGILVPLISLLLLISISLDTRFDVRAKVVLEDGTILLLPIAIVCIASSGFMFASFAWSRRRAGVDN